jgi:hypothetical protein
MSWVFHADFICVICELCGSCLLVRGIDCPQMSQITPMTNQAVGNGRRGFLPMPSSSTEDWRRMDAVSSRWQRAFLMEAEFPAARFCLNLWRRGNVVVVPRRLFVPWNLTLRASYQVRFWKRCAEMRRLVPGLAILHSWLCSSLERGARGMRRQIVVSDAV